MSKTGRIVVDGVVVEGEAPAVSALDMGFLHGDSLFTTMAVASGHPVFWEDHLERLRRSAEFFGYPPLPDGETLRADCLLAIESSPEPPSALRLTLSRGRSPVAGLDAVSERVLRIVLPLVRPALSPDRLKEGGEAEIFVLPWNPAGDPLRAHKTGNLLWAKWVRRQRKGNSTVEQLLVNPEGEILEGTITSIFGVDGEGVLRTAPLLKGVLPGVMRGRILEWAKKEGLPVREEALHLSELPSLKEIFLSSATLPVRPLRSLEGAGKTLLFPRPFSVAVAFLEDYLSRISVPS